MKRDKTISAENISILSAHNFALSPLDGRYASIGKKLSPYFSEYALMHNRVKVEVFWLKFLLETLNNSSKILDSFDKNRITEIVSIYTDFSDESYTRIKEFESETNHDVKSVELFVAEKLRNMGMDELVSFVHIGCTSEDINNPSYANMISSSLANVWIPAAEKLIDKIKEFAIKHADVPMLGHTHGQPATPTTVGKEMAVYVYRLKKSLENIRSIKTCAKFNGATGTYAAISIAFPDEDWAQLSKEFIEDYLGLKFTPISTQIESHDYVSHILDGIRHFDNVLRDFDVDIWLYISLDYLKQVPVKNEVGSSTMPHKVNPIRFENSEGNTLIANALFGVLSDSLPNSRMQRDLSDSSMQRNIGMAIGYSLQCIEQSTSGLSKIDVNKEKLSSELNNNWEILAEPIQTMLRKYGIPDAYDRLKEMTRGKKISQKDIQEFISSLDEISEKDKKALLELTPSKYIGLAADIVKNQLK